VISGGATNAYEIGQLNFVFNTADLQTVGTSPNQMYLLSRDIDWTFPQGSNNVGTYVLDMQIVGCDTGPSADWTVGLVSSSEFKTDTLFNNDVDSCSTTNSLLSGFLSDDPAAPINFSPTIALYTYT
jgi:hypothetical protein